MEGPKQPSMVPHLMAALKGISLRGSLTCVGGYTITFSGGKASPSITGLAGWFKDTTRGPTTTIPQEMQR